MFNIVFSKMHGLGNDIILVNEEQLQKLNKSDVVLKMSHRKIGLGCDQIVFYKTDNDCYITDIYNNNGSSVLACGNAYRCLAMLISKTFNISSVKLRVADKYIICDILENGLISVDMGVVSFKEKWMCDIKSIKLLIGDYLSNLAKIIMVDVGNHHLIIFDDINFKMKKLIGNIIRKSDFFKDGININFAKIQENKIFLSVLERGAGFTMSCGSGACATFAAAVEKGLVTSPSEVVFKLGSLKMMKSRNRIILHGPANFIAYGSFYYE